MADPNKKDPKKAQLGAGGNGAQATTVDDKSGTGAQSTLQRGIGAVGKVLNNINPFNNVASNVVKTLTDGSIVNGAKALGSQVATALTTPPTSQNDLNASRVATTPVAPSKVTTPVGVQSTKVDSLPDGGFRTNTYTNGANSVTFGNRTLSDTQVSNLDKTLEYNRRPEVIEGFAKNAALSQARYDDYFKKKEVGDLTARLDGELSKRFPNPTVVNNLQERLKLGSEEKATGPSFADVNKADEAKARLQLDINKGSDAKNNKFMASLTKEDPSGRKRSLNNILAEGEGLGADYNVDVVSQFSDAPQETLARLGSAKTSEEYLQTLKELGVSPPLALKATQKKFK
jgi:hypothetical protein